MPTSHVRSRAPIAIVSPFTILLDELHDRVLGDVRGVGIGHAEASCEADEDGAIASVELRPHGRVVHVVKSFEEHGGCAGGVEHELLVWVPVSWFSA